MHLTIFISDNFVVADWKTADRMAYFNFKGHSQI